MNHKRLAQLEDFLKAEPNDPFLKYGIAQEYMSGGEFATAESHFARLLKEHPDYVAGYYHHGLALMQLERMDDAAEVWRVGVEKANAAGDRHAASELKQMLEEVDDEYDW